MYVIYSCPFSAFLLVCSKVVTCVVNFYSSFFALHVIPADFPLGYAFACCTVNHTRPHERIVSSKVTVSDETPKREARHTDTEWSGVEHGFSGQFSVGVLAVVDLRSSAVS